MGVFRTVRQRGDLGKTVVGDRDPGSLFAANKDSLDHRPRESRSRGILFGDGFSSWALISVPDSDVADMAVRGDTLPGWSTQSSFDYVCGRRKLPFACSVESAQLPDPRSLTTTRHFLSGPDAGRC